jgi:hypothetical protein
MHNRENIVFQLLNYKTRNLAVLNAVFHDFTLHVFSKTLTIVEVFRVLRILNLLFYNI